MKLPQAVNNLLVISRFIPKGAIIGVIKENTTKKKNVVNIIIDARKRKNDSTILYLKVIYMPHEACHFKRQPEIYQEKRKSEMKMMKREIGARC